METSFCFFAGVDVSKAKLDVCLLGLDGSSSLYRSFANTLQGFKALLQWVSASATETRQVLFCMEHTGLYTAPLCLFLSQNALHFALVPALEIKRSIGVKRGKSDRVDAACIAQYALLRRDHIVLYQLPGSTVAKLKQLLVHRSLLVRFKAALGVNIKEKEVFLEKQLVAVVNKQGRQLVTNIESKVRKVDAEILALIRGDEHLQRLYGLLISLPGIGLVIAAQLLVYTRGFTLFENARKFACYAGVVPFEYASGSRLKGRPRVSALANKKIKSLLNLAVLTAIKRDHQLRAYYERKVAEGKNKMLVLNNLRNKLVHRIFATIQRGTPYVLTMNYNN